MHANQAVQAAANTSYARKRCWNHRTWTRFPRNRNPLPTLPTLPTQQNTVSAPSWWQPNKQICNPNAVIRSRQRHHVLLPRLLWRRHMRIWGKLAGGRAAQSVGTWFVRAKGWKSAEDNSRCRCNCSSSSNIYIYIYVYICIYIMPAFVHIFMLHVAGPVRLHVLCFCQHAKYVHSIWVKSCYRHVFSYILICDFIYPWRRECVCVIEWW